jgi:hypothetical protein
MWLREASENQICEKPMGAALSELDAGVKDGFDSRVSASKLKLDEQLR